MTQTSDIDPLQRLALYESLVAQTRPLWIGEAAGAGAVLEHLRYRTDEIAYRALLGSEASQPYETFADALFWLAERDPNLQAEAIHSAARALEARETMTACSTGVYLIDAQDGTALETCFVPMALTPYRLRIERDTLFWEDGIAQRPNNDLASAQGVEFGAGTLPFALADFLKASMKMRWAHGHSEGLVVAAKLALFQRYAHHDPAGLIEFLHEHTAF